MTRNLLALETSSAYCSVALLRADGQACTVAARGHDGVQEHAERLLPLVDELLAQAGLAPGDLHAVAFGQGPGGFTGLRVACGVAQGMGLALDIPVVPVVSHLAVAEQVAAGPDEIVAVALDARMEEVYLAAYRARPAGGWEILQPPVLIAAPAVPAWLEQAAGGWAAGGRAPALIAAGNAWETYAQHMPLPAGWRRAPAARPDAASVARLAWRAWEQGGGLPADAAAPLYVRDKVAFTTAERLQGEGGNPRAAAPPPVSGAAASPSRPATSSPVVAAAAQAVPLPAEVELAVMAEADLDAVVEIERAVQSFPWTRGNFADALAAGYDAWVLRSAGQVRGFYVSMAAPDLAHLLVIAVAPGAQRRGLGGRLLSHCEERVRRSGSEALLLEVRPSNATAVEFYRRRGYLQIGVRRGYYPAGRSEREDALVMKKSLAAGAAGAQA